MFTVLRAAMDFSDDRKQHNTLIHEMKWKIPFSPSPMELKEGAALTEAYRKSEREMQSTHGSVDRDDQSNAFTDKAKIVFVIFRYSGQP